MARSPKDPNDRKRVPIEIDLDPDDEEMLLARAAARKISPEDYIAKLIHHDLAVVKEQTAVSNLKLRRKR